MAKKQNKPQKKKASQQSGNPVVLGVPEIMTPAEFQLFMERSEKKHANFMANLKTDEKRKAAEKQHKENVKVLTEHIHVMKPSEAEKLGSKAESKASPKQQEAPTPTQKLSFDIEFLAGMDRKAEILRENPDIPSDFDVDGEEDLVIDMLYGDKKDLATIMAIKVKAAKIKVYEEFYDKFDELNLKDRLKGLSIKDSQKHMEDLGKALTDFAKGKQTLKEVRIIKEKIELLKALDELQDLMMKYKSDMKGIREREEQCRKVKVMVMGLEEVIQMHQKPSDKKKSLNVGASGPALSELSQEDSDSEDSEDFSMPTQEEMFRDREILNNMKKEGRTDELFLELLKVKTAKVEMYYEYSEINKKFESNGFDLDPDHLAQEALIAFNMFIEFREGRGDEQKLAILQDKIDQVRNFDLMAESAFEFQRKYRDFCKQEESLKEKNEQEGSVSAGAPAAVQAPQEQQEAPKAPALKVETPAPTEKTLGSVDASSVLAVLSLADALKVRASKYSAPKDPESFAAPACDERQAEVYIDIVEKGKNDPNFQQTMGKKYADAEIFIKHLEKLTELEGRLEDLNYKNLSQEVKLLNGLVVYLKAGRRVEETMELLEKKICQINACFDLLEAYADFKCFVKGMEEHNEQEKKVEPVDESKMNQKKETPKQTAEKSEKTAKDQKTTTTAQVQASETPAQAKLQDFVSADRHYEQVLSNLEILDKTSLYDPYPDFEFLTQEEIQREIEIATYMEEKGRTDPLFQKACEVKVAKLETYVKLNKKYQEVNLFFKDDPNARNMAQETKNFKEMLQNIHESRRDERSLRMLLEKTNKIMGVFEMIVALHQLKGELKGKCEQEESLNREINEKGGAVPEVPPVDVQSLQKEQKTSTPTPEDAFQFPTDEDLSREIQILSNMQKRGRTDPSFQKALNVKQTKIEIYKAFLEKVDELQLRDRLEDLTVENMERDAKDLQDTLNDFQKGDVKTMPVLREKIDSLVASLEINEIVSKLKSDLKGIWEQEEQCIKEGTMVAPARRQASVPALPKQQQATKAPEVKVEEQLVPEASSAEDIDDFPMPTTEDILRECEEYTSMLKENRPDPLFQQVLKLKGQKHEVFKTYRIKALKLEKRFGGLDMDELKQEYHTLRELAVEVVAGRVDEQSAKISEEQKDRMSALMEMVEVMRKFKSDWKRLCELEDDLKKNREQVASVIKSPASSEVQATKAPIPAEPQVSKPQESVPKQEQDPKAPEVNVPTPEEPSAEDPEDPEDIPFPPAHEIVRDCEEYAEMAKQADRLDPLFHKALDLRWQKCDMHKKFGNIVSEFQERFGTLDIDELKREYVEFYDLVADMNAGRSDGRPLTVEMIDRMSAFEKLTKEMVKYKSDVKRMSEMEEDLKKKREQLAKVFKTMASKSFASTKPQALAPPKQPKPAENQESTTAVDPDFKYPSSEEITREYEILAEMEKDLEKVHTDMHIRMALWIQYSKVEIFEKCYKKMEELKDRTGDFRDYKEEREVFVTMQAKWETGQQDIAELPEYVKKLRKIKAFNELADFKNEMIIELKAVLEQEAHFKKFGTLLDKEPQVEVKEEPKEKSEKRDLEKIKAEKKAEKKAAKKIQKEIEKEIQKKLQESEEPEDWTRTFILSFIVLVFLVILYLV